MHVNAISVEMQLSVKFLHSSCSITLCRNNICSNHIMDYMCIHFTVIYRLLVGFGKFDVVTV